MNTRTRTNLHISKDAVAFAELVSASYKSGTVAIIYEDKFRPLAERISDALYKKGNRSKLYMVTSLEQSHFGEHIRYFIAVGGVETMKAARRAAGECRLALYQTELVADCFCDGLLCEEKNGFAEISYFDTSIVDVWDTRTAAEGYCEILTMFLSLLDIYCCALFLPYKDSALEVLVKEIKSFIVKPPDRDYFLPTMLKLLKGGAEYLSGKGKLPLLYRIRNNHSDARTLSSRFFVCYLLFCLGIIFTKWNFNDMLIPAVTMISTQPCAPQILKAQSAKIGAYMLTREELNHVAMVFRAMNNSFETIDVWKHWSFVVEESRHTQGLINIINNTGVIERLINYEKHEEY